MADANVRSDALEARVRVLEEQMDRARPFEDVESTKFTGIRPTGLADLTVEVGHLRNERDVLRRRLDERNAGRLDQADKLMVQLDRVAVALDLGPADDLAGAIDGLGEKCADLKVELDCVVAQRNDLAERLAAFEEAFEAKKKALKAAVRERDGWRKLAGLQEKAVDDPSIRPLVLKSHMDRITKARAALDPKPEPENDDGK